MKSFISKYINAVLYVCTKEPKSRIFWHPKTQKTPTTRTIACCNHIVIKLGNISGVYSYKMLKRFWHS
jgi:hypothetical protein